MLSILNQYGFQKYKIPRFSYHHQKLLHSIKDWHDFGFWQLGGLLTFSDNDSYTGRFPTALYSSHSPFYSFPHWIAYSIGREKYFYLAVVILTIIFTISLAVALGLLTSRLLPDKLLSQFHPTTIACFATLLATPSEATWGIAFNNFDSTPAFQVYLLSLTAIVCARSTRRQVFAALLIVGLVPLLAPRFGLAVAATLILTRWSLALRGQIQNMWPGILLLLRLRTIAIIASISSLHFLHVWIVKSVFAERFAFKGSDLLWRSGLTAAIESQGQGDYDYVSIWQAFTFLWRQSEHIQNLSKFPAILDIEHMLFWTLGIAGCLALITRLHDPNKVALLSLLILPGVLLTLILNQSSTEHPDYYNVFWLPALIIGWSHIAFSLINLLPHRTFDWRLPAAFLSSWMFFLWQVRYFRLAYPFS